jgi:HSP20 family protein
LLTEGSLEIRATREARVGSATDGSYRSEFHYGHYERTIPVPAGVDPEQIRALYKDGILEVRLPWPAHSERPHPMRVQVGRGE